MASLPNWELVLERALVGNGQFLSALSTPCGQHPSAIGGRHALPEPVLVPSLSPGRLVCSFHDSDDLASFMRAAKIITNSKSPKSPEGDAPFGRIPSGQGIASVARFRLFDNKFFLRHGRVELYGGGFYSEGLWAGVLDHRQRKFDSGLFDIVAVRSGLRNFTHRRVVRNDHSHLQPRLSVKVYCTLATKRECI